MKRNDLGLLISLPFSHHLLMNRTHLLRCPKLSHGLNGKLQIDNTVASLDGKAEIDGLALDIKLRQPVKGDMATREWEASGDLTEAEVLKFAPALKPYINGGMNVALKTTKDGQRA
ncbi:MAG: hypothetical protein EOO10_17940, partial [Chitinophagaceae bacterium]